MGGRGGIIPSVFHFLEPGRTKVTLTVFSFLRGRPVAWLVEPGRRVRSQGAAVTTAVQKARVAPLGRQAPDTGTPEAVRRLWPGRLRPCTASCGSQRPGLTLGHGRLESRPGCQALAAGHCADPAQRAPRGSCWCVSRTLQVVSASVILATLCRWETPRPWLRDPAGAWRGCGCVLGPCVGGAALGPSSRPRPSAWGP